MSRSVNLFVGPLKLLSKRAQMVGRIRNYSILTSVFLFIAIFSLYLYKAKIVGDIYLVQQEQIVIEGLIDKEAGRQKDLGAILARLKLMRSSLANDVAYASRSAAIEDIIGSVDSKPSLEEISFKNPQEFKTKLGFSSQEDIVNFIKASESVGFARRLKSFSIGSFKISLSTASAGLSVVDFSGTFL